MLLLLRRNTARAARRDASSNIIRSFASHPRSNYRVLAIETSCDDTSVAVVDFKRHESGNKTGKDSGGSVNVLYHNTKTANNDAYSGIHPLVALHSHRASLAPLVQDALIKTQKIPKPNDSPTSTDTKSPSAIDLIAVTRGPGMRSNLSVGLDTAKGLALAFDVPLIGVHHMQAHALTSRLVSAMNNAEETDSSELTPGFPFLSVLVSGGHTMLIDSTGLTEHKILAETQDIAIGDCLDKSARAILPQDLHRPPFGRALEQFAFHSDDSISNTVDYDYKPPLRRRDELERRPTGWDWSLAPPLSDSSKGGLKSSKRMEYSFTGISTSIERIAKAKTGVSSPGALSIDERRDMAREVQRIAFEHLASRILLYLDSPETKWNGDTVVVSGGVASNSFLRHVLRSILDARGYSHIKLSFPPAKLCTDNALMIAWAGIEMYEAGHKSELDIGPIRKWSMDSSSEDGGILGIQDHTVT